MLASKWLPQIESNGKWNGLIMHELSQPVLRVKSANPAEGSITLAWDDGTEGQCVSSYSIYRSANDTFTEADRVATGITDTEWTDTGYWNAEPVLSPLNYWVVAESDYFDLPESNAVETRHRYGLFVGVGKYQDKDFEPDLSDIDNAFFFRDLEIEAYLLSNLKAFGLPAMKTFGYNSKYNILIMELLGPSLENLFQKLNKKFSLKTACMLGIQMVDRIEYIHSRKIIHRDIKPDNFVIGRGNRSHIVYILDFGLSKKYWSTRQNKHIQFCRNKKLTGTARYASINALSGCEQGRRDDLESIGYIIMYFIRGSLPWQGLKVNKKEDRYKKICDKKKETSAKELCMGFPKEFENFVSYIRAGRPGL